MHTKVLNIHVVCHTCHIFFQTFLYKTTFSVLLLIIYNKFERAYVRMRVRILLKKV